MIKYYSFFRGLFNLSLYRILYFSRIKSIGLLSSFHGDISIGKKGSEIFIGRNFRGRKNCFFNITSGRLIIGDNVFLNRSISINCHSEISIGDNCLFGEGVKIYDHDHSFSDTSKLIKDQGFDSKRVSIGKNVWIGSNVIILKGVSIGDNCVIAAGSIVRNSVPSDTVFVQKRETTLIPL